MQTDHVALRTALEQELDSMHDRLADAERSFDELASRYRKTIQDVRALLDEPGVQHLLPVNWRSRVVAALRDAPR